MALLECLVNCILSSDEREVIARQGCHPGLGYLRVAVTADEHDEDAVRQRVMVSFGAGNGISRDSSSLHLISAPWG